MTPSATLRAARNKKATLARLPPCLGDPSVLSAQERNTPDVHLNMLLESLPDRLATSRWRKRCPIIGAERVYQAVRDKQPMILAFAHFGPVRLIRPMLRAAGIPVATLSADRPHRSAIRRMADARAPFPDIPQFFYVRQLREAVKHLTAGNILQVAIDVETGAQIEVPFGEGWTFRMATGALRLAVKYNAPLLPVTIFDEGDWRFQIKIDDPVPRELLVDDSYFFPAGKYLLDRMSPYWRARPEKCWNNLRLCFRQVSVPPGNQIGSKAGE